MFEAKIGGFGMRDSGCGMRDAELNGNRTPKTRERIEKLVYLWVKNPNQIKDTMKKILLLISILIIGISGSLLAKKVELKDARLVGKNFYYERVNQYQATPYATIAIREEIVEKAGNEPVYYIFNFDNEKGFVIVSADDAVVPVLGYGFEGTFSADAAHTNVQWWMDKCSDEIVYVKDNNLPADLEITSAWNRLLTSDENSLVVLRGTMDVAPLVTSQWNQDFPYNALCPEDAASTGSYMGRVPVGCVATAMSQLMYYWRYPATGQGSHCIFPTPSTYGAQCANFGTTTYEWNGMTDKPTKECYPAAVISYQAGVAVDMDYGPNGSGAYSSKVPNALINYFKYGSTCQYIQKMSYATTEWENKLKTELDAKRPTYYAGSGPDGGHAWVCDGYQGTNYFHFNWGWGGSDDGYYYLTNLNPGGSNFNQSQQAVIGIQPPTASYPPYCSGQANLNTYLFGSIEDGSGPILDYQNNENCSWLIAPNDSISSIKLTFVKFSTEASDEIKVYDGDNTGAPLIGTYSGATLPSMITSTGGKMLVTFTSNGSGTGTGFIANYDASTVNFCQSSTTINTWEGVISDGSNNYPYRNSTSCKWKIQPPNATSVTLTFTDFNTEADNDLVLIYDLVTSELLGTFSGSTLPPAVTANSGKMLIMFNTNASVRGDGWSADYIVLGTEEAQGFDDLRIYPNPASDFVTINFSLTDNQNLRVELFNMNGSVLRSESYTNYKGDFEKRIDLSNLSKGVYMLRLTSDKGIVNRKITVK